MTRCADCGRVLHAKPALVIGRCAFGPVCAKRYIVRPTRTRHLVFDRLPRVVRRFTDPRQLELEWLAA